MPFPVQRPSAHDALAIHLSTMCLDSQLYHNTGGLDSPKQGLDHGIDHPSERIGNPNGILAQPIGNTTPKTPLGPTRSRRWRMPLAPGDDHSPSGLRQPALRLAVRRGADMRRLDMLFRIGEVEASEMPSSECLGKASLEGRGGRISNGISKPQEGEIHRRCAHVADEP